MACSAAARPTPDRCRLPRRRPRSCPRSVRTSITAEGHPTILTSAAPRLRRLAAPGYALLLSLLLLAPLLGPGYLLLRDAVSTPRSWLSDAALGISEGAARAVPQDFAIASASALLDGGIVVKALLLAGVWLAGWGAARLAAQTVTDEPPGSPRQFVAATLAIWNPYVAERLLQGHWSLLLGYGCLPWVAMTALRLRDDGSRQSCPPDNAVRRVGGWFALAFWLALAGLTPTGLLLAAVTALTCLAAPGSGSRVRQAAGVLALSLAAATPWLIASSSGALGAYQRTGAPGFDAFAARAEPGLGTLGSLAGLGGIWNADAVPPLRGSWFAAVATIVLLTPVLLGLRAAWRQTQVRPLLVLAAAAVLLPALAATGAGRALLQAAAEVAPGLGVLRDGQKWVALAMPGYAVCAAAAIPAITAWNPRLRPAAVAAVCCAALLATQPDLMFGVGNRVHASAYPAAFTAVAQRINDAPAPVAVLPADSMRRFDWAGPAPVLDPLPRWVRADVLSTGDLSISGSTVYGEGNRARDIQDLLLAGAAPKALADAGVGWVVVEAGSPGELGDSARTLAGLEQVLRDDELRLYRVPEPSAVAAPSRRGLMIGAHLVWLATLVVGGLGAAAFASRRSCD